MLIKRIQLALIHVAVAMTLVPINSTLNRVMIKELALSATLVAILASLPYLFSPLQVLIGSYSDRHPIFGWRRSPYIALGLFLCAGAVQHACGTRDMDLLGGLGRKMPRTLGVWLICAAGRRSFTFWLTKRVAPSVWAERTAEGAAPEAFSLCV